MFTRHMNHIHFEIRIDLQFLAIRTRWAVRVDEMHGDRVFVPSVDQRGEHATSLVADPWKIRSGFLKMKRDEDLILKFLNGVGVWNAIEDRNVAQGRHGSLVSGGTTVGTKDMLMVGAFGLRYFAGYAQPVTVEDVSREQERWRGLLGDLPKMHAEFAPLRSNPRAHDRYMHALQTYFRNTLPLHLEWKGKHPVAVVQPITMRELLTALAWIEVVTDADFKWCKKCGNPFTVGRSYCSDLCQRARNVSQTRKRNNSAKKLIQANPEMPIQELQQRLSAVDIDRTAKWIARVRTEVKKHAA